MELLKVKKDKETKKSSFIVKLSEDEYIKTNNFLNQNKDRLLVYLGNGTWGPAEMYDKNNTGNINQDNNGVVIAHTKTFQQSASSTDDVQLAGVDDTIILNEGK